MSWQIEQQGDTTVVVLESEMGIRHAADFHQAVLAIAQLDGVVRVDARAAGCIHSSIMQILYALSRAVPDFGVDDVSSEFRAAEIRVGISLPRSEETETPAALAERE